MEDQEPEAQRQLVFWQRVILGMAAIGTAGVVIRHFASWEAASAIFTGLAFVGVIATMLLQSAELRLQRAELKLTRGELRGQKEQLQAQDRTLRKQTFEGTYFQLLRSFRNLADTASQVALRDHVGDAYWFYIGRQVFTPVKGHNNINDQVAEFESQLRSHPTLAPYLAYLGEILIFLEKSEFGSEPLYARLLRSQFRADELNFVAFFGLTAVGSRAFKERVEKFGLLRFLQTDPSSPGHLVAAAYAPTAMQDPAYQNQLAGELKPTGKL